jgi:hypothetical protein
VRVGIIEPWLMVVRDVIRLSDFGLATVCALLCIKELLLLKNSFYMW